MKIEEYLKSITPEDIKIIDKLDNMYDNELMNKRFYCWLISEKEKAFSFIENNIQKNAEYFMSFIYKETIRLYNEGVVDRADEWSAGLYNCDQLYIKAILCFCKEYGYDYSM